MDVMERLRQLVAMMNENDLAEVEVEEPQLRIKVAKKQALQYIPPGFSAAQLQQLPGYHPALEMPQVSQGEGLPARRQENLVEISSPMVGTFYRASSPGGEPYVSVGVRVDPDAVVCIIEAMKVMNEIRAEVSGEIVEILIEDTEPVEFGQVLFLVRPEED